MNRTTSTALIALAFLAMVLTLALLVYVVRREQPFQSGATSAQPTGGGVRKFSDGQCEAIAQLYVVIATECRDKGESPSFARSLIQDPDHEFIVHQVYVDYKNLTPDQIHERVIAFCRTQQE